MIEVLIVSEMGVFDVNAEGVEVLKLNQGSTGPFLFIGNEMQHDHLLSQGSIEVDAESGAEVMLEIQTCDFRGNPGDSRLRRPNESRKYARAGRRRG